MYGSCTTTKPVLVIDSCHNKWWVHLVLEAHLLPKSAHAKNITTYIFEILVFNITYDG